VLREFAAIVFATKELPLHERVRERCACSMDVFHAKLCHIYTFEPQGWNLFNGAVPSEEERCNPNARLHSIVTFDTPGCYM